MVMDTMAGDSGTRGDLGRAVAAASDFDHFYMGNYRRMLAIAVAATGDFADAEDLVQDAFADAHRKWATVAGYDDPVAFVCRALLNRGVSRWRRRAREVAMITRLQHHRVGISTAPESFDAEFWRVVAALPAQQAKAIALYYVADLSISEVAGFLGCSEGATKSHLSRARQHLKTALTATVTTNRSDSGDAT